MECRPGCAACCKIFGRPERPRICGAFQPDPLICGQSRAEAVKIMAELEDIDSGKFL